jgi:acetyltransferase-like isoleucine patch superfamily enzyme
MIDLRSTVQIMAQRRTFQRALRHPSVLLQAMKAQIYLHRCEALPPSVRVLGRAHAEVYGDGAIRFGDRCLVRGTLIPSEFIAYNHGCIEIGERTFVNYGVSISAHLSVRIGRSCHIGQLTIINDNDFHSIEDKYVLPPSKAVVIEDRVWLGARVIVLKGVHIGQDSVVAAGSVVTSDVPPRSIVAGVPARLLRSF